MDVDQKGRRLEGTSLLEGNAVAGRRSDGTPIGRDAVAGRRSEGALIGGNVDRKDAVARWILKEFRRHCWTLLEVNPTLLKEDLD